VKIREVVANNRRHLFEVKTAQGTMVFPYAKTEPAPSPDDRIVEVYVDPDLGREGFTYRLESGLEGSVHVDAVLEYNEDPSYMADLTLYRLTTEARERFESSGLSAARSLAGLAPRPPSSTACSIRPTTRSRSSSCSPCCTCWGPKLKSRFEIGRAGGQVEKQRAASLDGGPN
jgi:hypothetical protein